MIENVVILPEALGDVIEARAWYENRSARLGDRFLDRVDDCIGRIRKDPDVYEQVYKDNRRAIVHRFPYAVFHEFGVDTITVFSVFHNAQDPQKWRRRLS